MYELRLATYQGKIYLADNVGNIIMKNLRADQILDVNKYERKRIKFLGT